METYVNKKTWRHMKLSVHTTNTVEWPDRILFSDSSYRQWDGDNTFCGLNPGHLVLIDVIRPSFLVSTPHFAKLKFLCGIFLFSFSPKNRDFFLKVMETKCRLFNVRNWDDWDVMFSQKTVLLKFLYHSTKPFNDLHYLRVQCLIHSFR